MDDTVSLSRFLSNNDINRILFIFESSTFSYGDFLKVKELNQKYLEILKNKNVVIYGESRSNCAILNLLLDGVANSILFLPNDITEALYVQYTEASCVHYRVTIDRGVLIIHDLNIELMDFILHRETAWIIPTSGTTNVPKLISHNLKSLTRTTKTNTQIGQRYRWGLVYDIYRFAGLQVYLQALLGGASLVIVENTTCMKDIVSIFIESNCNALSATPSFWRKMAMVPDFSSLPLELITLGGEIADTAILSFLSRSFSNAKIAHIYASTEAGVGFSVVDGKAGFPVSYLDDNILGLSIDKHNHLYILNELGTNVDTEDIVEVRDDRVYFLGRDSGSINVGGNKVLPEEVENKLLELNYIKLAKVYPKKNNFLGNLVCADIVINESELGELDFVHAKEEIFAFCRRELVTFKVPVKINFVDSIEMTLSGKVKR